MSALDLFERSQPISADAHLLETDDQHLVLLPNGNRLYDIDAETYDALDRARRAGGLEPLLAELGLDAPRYVDDAPPEAPPVRALSLAVAQKCNLGCTYC